MNNYADRLVEAILQKGNPCIVGLDPRLDEMPGFIRDNARREASTSEEQIRACITTYHELIIDATARIVPGVKLQIAFYERYGIGGLLALYDTVGYAKSKNLVVIIDAKRSDIDSTAQAYADALLGRTKIFGQERPIIDADCITVSPYLGRDSLEPFVETCQKWGKGIFILVKTSNPGAGDLQDLRLADGSEVYEKVAEWVGQYTERLMGIHGYSSIGAVVGATYPAQAAVLRSVLPRVFFLVPGYGAQGATGSDVAPCFNSDGLGAVVNASRSLTYGFGDRVADADSLQELVVTRTQAMIGDVTRAIKSNKMKA